MSPLTAENLAIETGGHRLINGLELRLMSSQCWAILGANGCGKTTLLHTLAGLRAPHAGAVSLNGKPMGKLSRPAIARQLGLLLQESHDPFPSTVWEGALSGRHPHLGRWQDEGDADHKIVADALNTMGLQGMEQRMVQTLSGGERRRLAIATLLAQDTQLLLLDEPLNHLDLHHQQQLLKLLQQLTTEGKTVLMVLHDPNQALRYCDHCLLLYGDGQWQSGDVETLLTTENLGRLYHHPLDRIEQHGLRLFIPR